METRRRSITSTVPALFETATSAPQPECIRTPMAARFMFEVCLRMCYGEFISSFAACLGKIGQILQGDSFVTPRQRQNSMIELILYHSPKCLHPTPSPSRHTRSGFSF